MYSIDLEYYTLRVSTCVFIYVPKAIEKFFKFLQYEWYAIWCKQHLLQGGANAKQRTKMTAC